MGDVFLNDDGLISIPPVCQEASLGGADDILEDRLDFVSNYFGNNLETGVAQANGTEVYETINISTLRNEANKGSVIISRHNIFREDPFVERDSLWVNVSPILLEKKGWIPSGPGAFTGLKNLMASMISKSLRGATSIFCMLELILL